jgi:hypothetical protein
MEGIKKYILQQELLNRLNKNQIDFFNTLYDDVNRTSNKTEKEIKLEILDQLLKDYKMYKINKTMDDMMDVDITYTNTDKK